MIFVGSNSEYCMPKNSLPILYIQNGLFGQTVQYCNERNSVPDPELTLL